MTQVYHGAVKVYFNDGTSVIIDYGINRKNEISIRNSSRNNESESKSKNLS